MTSSINREPLRNLTDNILNKDCDSLEDHGENERPSVRAVELGSRSPDDPQALLRDMQGACKSLQLQGLENSMLHIEHAFLVRPIALALGDVVCWPWPSSLQGQTKTHFSRSRATHKGHMLIVHLFALRLTLRWTVQEEDAKQAADEQRQLVAAQSQYAIAELTEALERQMIACDTQKAQQDQELQRAKGIIMTTSHAFNELRTFTFAQRTDLQRAREAKDKLEQLMAQKDAQLVEAKALIDQFRPAAEERERQLHEAMEQLKEAKVSFWRVSMSREMPLHAKISCA
jgi:hypothetical protein